MKSVKFFENMACAAALSLSVFSCADRNAGPLKWVDLRYEAEDSYSLPAASPEPFTFRVRSSDPWRVYGYNPEWSTITPSEGEAGVDYDVTVAYSDNPGLDDRTDTLVIRSDYWTGKWIRVVQKGTAYLDFENADDILLNMGGGEGSFGIRSNQNWSVEVTEGSRWLSLSGVPEGSGDGIVRLSAVRNTDEIRYGKVAVYDRHGELFREISVTQDGVQIVPATSLVKTDSDGKEYSLEVVANSAWRVETESSGDWFSFPQTRFDGSAGLRIVLSENASPDVRSLRFRLVSEENGNISKEIVLKQAYRVEKVRRPFYVDDPDPDLNDWVKDGNPNRKGTFGLSSSGVASFSGDARILSARTGKGTYRYHLKSMSPDAYVIIYFLDRGNSSQEIRWHLDGKKGMTAMSLRPTPSPNEVTNVSFDSGLPHTLALDLSMSEYGYLQFEWSLDGQTLNTYVADGSTGGPKITFGGMVTVHLGTTAGSAEFDWWEYTPAIDWSGD